MRFKNQPTELDLLAAALVADLEAIGRRILALADHVRSEYIGPRTEAGEPPLD